MSSQNSHHKIVIAGGGRTPGAARPLPERVQPSATYGGYASCPLTTSRNRMLLKSRA